MWSLGEVTRVGHGHRGDHVRRHREAEQGAERGCRWKTPEEKGPQCVWTPTPAGTFPRGFPGVTPGGQNRLEEPVGGSQGFSVLKTRAHTGTRAACWVSLPRQRARATPDRAILQVRRLGGQQPPGWQAALPTQTGVRGRRPHGNRGPRPPIPYGIAGVTPLGLRAASRRRRRFPLSENVVSFLSARPPQISTPNRGHRPPRSPGAPTAVDVSTRGVRTPPSPGVGTRGLGGARTVHGAVGETSVGSPGGSPQPEQRAKVSRLLEGS